MSRKTTGTPVASRRVVIGTALVSATALIGSGLALATDGTDPAVAHVYNVGTTEAATAGPLSGRASAVEIVGTNLKDAKQVFFGSLPAAGFTHESDTLIYATPPAAAAAGKVDVTVSKTVSDVGTALTDSTADDYTYTAGPVVTKAEVTGTPKKLVITGSQFAGATAVLLGDNLVKIPKATAAVKPINAGGTEISIAAPSAKGGLYDVSVISPNGIGTKTAAWGAAPTLSKLFVNGPRAANGSVPQVAVVRSSFENDATATATTGATSTVTVFASGTGFSGLKEVTFGKAKATFVVVSDTLARIGVPAMAADDVSTLFTTATPNSAKVDVTFKNAFDSVKKAGAWTYDRLPTATAASFKKGDATIVEKAVSDTSTTTVKITGTNLYKVSAVKLGTSATSTATLVSLSKPAGYNGKTDGTEWEATFKNGKVGTPAGTKVSLFITTPSGTAKLENVFTWK